MKRLFGLTGPANVGKDTIGDRLCIMHDFVVTSFAQPLREAASIAFGIDYEWFVHRGMKNTHSPYWDMTPRQMAQLMGTEAMRNTFGQDFWIKRWRMTYDLVSQIDHVVVTDVRFENEATAIRDLGGTIIHVMRDVPDEEGNHASAQGIEYRDGDLVIDNSTDFKSLYAQIDRIAGGFDE